MHEFVKCKKWSRMCDKAVFFILGVCLLATMISFSRDVTVTSRDMFHRHNGSTMKNTGNVWIEKEHEIIMLRRVGVEVLK